MSRSSYQVTTAQIIAGIGIAIAVGAPPAAAAEAAQPSCVTTGSSTQCQTAGNVQITTGQPGSVGPQSGGLSSYGPFFTYDRGGR
jgi:hypothetical protein